MTPDRRKADTNGDWNEYRRFVMAELKRQGEVQTIMLESINNINTHLATQEEKVRNVAGIVSVAVSGVVSLISGIIIFIIERGKG
jgi:ABC-type glucose/galactose transport system permease subunit